MTTIQLNGKPHEIDEQTSVQRLLETLNIAPKSILVELNGTAVLRQAYDQTFFKPDDRVELLRVVGGG